MIKRKLENKLVGFGKYKEKELKWVAKNDLSFFKEIRKLYYQKYTEEKKKVYDKLENLFINTGVKENDEDFQICVAEVVGWLRSKKKNEEIFALLRERFEDYPTGYGQEVFMHAKTFLRKEFELEKENMVHLHLMRYEQIWDDNFNANLDHIKPGYRNVLKCEKYLVAMETLFQKEKLLGIHSKKFREKLKTNNVVVEQNQKFDFDFNKLNFDQQLRLSVLLEKCKPVEKINREVTSDEEENTVEVKVIEEQIFDNPIQKSKETDVLKEEEMKIKEERGKSSLEVRQNINKSLEDRVKEIFDKKFPKK